jgi:peptide/nickel transport system substrate-binding protein
VEASNGFRVTATDVPFVNQLSFSLNVAQAPFTDPRVVEAFKYAIDRQGIVDTVFFGRAIVGNDLPSIGFPDYVEVEQRPYDPERARQLIQDAGAGNVPVTLTTGPEIPGMAEAATVFAENLKAVGVTVTLDELPPGQLYANFAANTQRQFVGGYNPPQPALIAYQSLRSAGSPTAFGFHRPDIDALVTTARSGPDPAQRQQAMRQAARALWADGNIIIPVFAPTLHGHVPTVQGVRYEPFANFAAAAIR